MSNNIKICDLDLIVSDFEKKAVSLGNFDGVHKGHQKLMRENISISKTYDLIPSVLLFKENTKKRLNNEVEYLTSIEDKIEILSDIGIDTFCILEFSKEFRDLSPREFVSEILDEKLNTKYVIIGPDYRFGKEAKGDVDTLIELEDEYGYNTLVVDYEKDDGHKISSSDIRKFIKSGDIKRANEYLGRFYKIRGIVIDGFKRGRRLNFPTANLKLSFNYVIPKDGVYLTRVTIDRDKYFALTNIGTNPTFENNIERKIETYILDFNENIYGKNMSIEFLEFFRGDYKFNSVEDLIDQMELDKKRAYETIEKEYL